MPESLYFISGPTAVGKTELALSWAKENNAEILSCDALLFYKGMDIGTAKPSAQELKEVPHHGIDILPPSEGYDISQYIELAKKTVDDVISRGKNILITGGSSFYLKSFFLPVVDDLQISSEIKTRVEEIEKNDGLKGMLTELSKFNPNGTDTLDIKNPRRVIKALERCMASGLSVSELRERFESKGTIFDGYDRKLLILMRDRDELRERIAIRTRQMVDNGLIEEVKSLLKEGIENNNTAYTAIGYAQTISWIEEGENSIEDLIDSINHATSTLVRKQCSWFRNQLPKGKEINLSESTATTANLFD